MKKTLLRWLSQAINSVRLRGNAKHKRNIAKSHTVIERLSAFDNDGAALAYLRKIDPLVFLFTPLRCNFTQS